MIAEITRGHVRFRFENRTATISGEMLIPSPGLPDFVIYRESLQRWDDAPFEEIDEETKGRIFKELQMEMKAMGRVIEFE